MDQYTAADLMSQTQYGSRRTGNMQLRFADTSELIVTWPTTIAPASHLAACEEALRVVREKAAPR